MSSIVSSRRRRGRILSTAITLVLIAGGAAMAFYGSSHYFDFADSPASSNLSTYPAAKAEMVITVTEDGNVESAQNVDVKCQVAGGAAILWIIADGTEVKKGDKVVELDSSAIDDLMNTQQIAYNKAKTAVIQAEKNFQVAQITVKEYLEGTFVQSLETADTNITIAEENLRSSKNSLEYSERMFQRGYISQLELESQQFSVKRAELELNSARTAKKVLEEFTKTKTLEDLQSQVETARATVQSERAAFEMEEAKLKRLETQKANCVLTAPQDGMVVYANEQGGRGGQPSVTIEEGAAVRERQTILRLPDLSQMQVKVTVHESKVEEVRPGMRARIKVQGRELQGSVKSVANQPEPGSFWQGNVKEYAAIVRIDGTPASLKPGMTSQVEILVAHLKDVVTVPVSTVVEKRNEFFCWVKKSNGELEKRAVVLGLTNDQFVEVREGLNVGEEVIRNPRAAVSEAQEGDVTEEEADDIGDKFGESKSGAGDDGAAGGAPAGAGPGGPGRPGRDAAGAGPGGPDAGGPGGGGPDGAAGEGGERRRRGGGAGGGRGSMNLKELDKDSDGKVSREEAPEQMQGFFDRLDGNGDGFIDQAEVDAMRARRGGGEGGGPGGPGGPGGEGGAGGP